MNLAKLFGRWWPGGADPAPGVAPAPGESPAAPEGPSACDAPAAVPSLAVSLTADEQAGDPFLGYLG